ncbi:MAG: threonine/serine exporter family protein [Anaerolineae bacterium]|nr:threonine/serine exporter family protein [Anaerolineae bacterium]
MTLGNLLLQALLGFTVTAGFGVLFNVPRSALLYSAFVGAVGHIVRICLRELGSSAEVAAFMGAFIVGVVGYWFSRWRGLPRLIFTVTGVISMVPGIPAYETIIFFVRDDILGGIESAVRAGLIASAIALGLSTARLLMDTLSAKKETSVTGDE